MGILHTSSYFPTSCCVNQLIGNFSESLASSRANEGDPVPWSSGVCPEWCWSAISWPGATSASCCVQGGSHQVGTGGPQPCCGRGGGSTRHSLAPQGLTPHTSPTREYPYETSCHLTTSETLTHEVVKKQNGMSGNLGSRLSQTLYFCIYPLAFLGDHDKRSLVKSALAWKDT